MSDDQTASEQVPNEQERTPEADSAEAALRAEREAGAWDEVARALDELGQAVTAWTRALRDDPETRRHARDLKDGFERLGKQMGDTLDSASDTEFGRSVTQAAGRAGAAVTDAARKAGDQVAPFVITALRGAADGIRRAADGLETRASTGAGGEATEGEAAEGETAQGETAEAEAAIPEPPAAPEPPEPPMPDA